MGSSDVETEDSEIPEFVLAPYGCKLGMRPKFGYEFQWWLLFLENLEWITVLWLTVLLAATCWKHVRLYNWDCFLFFFFLRPLWDNIQVINLLETMWHTYGQFENMGCSAATWYLSVLQIYSCRSVQIYYRSADPGLAVRFAGIIGTSRPL